MYKKMLITVVIIALLAPGATAFAAPGNPAADSLMPHYGDALTLKKLGLFIGTNNGFELGRAPTRIEATVILIRLLGKESEALSQKNPHPFKDVPSWADPYIGYAYKNGLSGGISKDKFGSSDNISSAQYFTFILRALGYSDKNGEFKWQEALNAAYDWGIIGDSDLQYYLHNNTFLRDDVVYISAKLLNRGLKGQPKKRLINKLIEQGAVNEATAEEAGFNTREMLYASLDYGDFGDIMQIDSSAFDLEVDKTPGRSYYTKTVRNIRFKIDRTKLPDSVRNFTHVGREHWYGDIDRDSLGAFLEKGEIRLSPINSYEIDDEGYVMIYGYTSPYNVFVLSDSNNKLLGYIATELYFDTDMADYPNFDDRIELLDYGVIDEMVPLKNIKVTMERGMIKVVFDNSELPNAVYEDVRQFEHETSADPFPAVNDIDTSISLYSKATTKRLKESKHGIPKIRGYEEGGGVFHTLPWKWAKGLCLYLAFDSELKPIGYGVIKTLKALTH